MDADLTVKRASLAPQESWTPDHDSKVCSGCDQEFTLFKRRHHCRKCGSLFCGECTKWRVTVLGENKQKRVCLFCFVQLAGSPPEDDTGGDIAKSITVGEDEFSRDVVERASLVQGDNLERHLNQQAAAMPDPHTPLDASVLQKQYDELVAADVSPVKPILPISPLADDDTAADS